MMTSIVQSDAGALCTCLRSTTKDIRQIKINTVLATVINNNTNKTNRCIFTKANSISAINIEIRQINIHQVLVRTSTVNNYHQQSIKEFSLYSLLVKARLL